MAKYAIFVCFFAGQTAKRQPSVGQTAQAKINRVSITSTNNFCECGGG